MDSQEPPKIEVRKAEYDCSCCITQKSIEKGETALQIQRNPSAWMSRKGIRKIYELFSGPMEVEDQDLQGMLLDRNFKSATGTCIICKEQNQSETDAFVIGLFSQLWVHEDCTEEFAKLLREEVEGSAAEFL